MSMHVYSPSATTNRTINLNNHATYKLLSSHVGKSSGWSPMSNRFFPFRLFVLVLFFQFRCEFIVQFLFCACVFMCMFNSSAFTMATNIPPEEDKLMHLAGLDMTRGSLQDILDGEDVNVSTALPIVPLDATNPFINPNQTLVDIIPGRNLGPLSSLKITDVDLIIRNLNSKLNITVEKNDTSMALLQRMDQHQKHIEAQVAELKAETIRLEEEKETAIREKCDYTINQERLAENIRRDLEKEYADRAQDYLKQLKDEMRAKI